MTAELTAACGKPFETPDEVTLCTEPLGHAGDHLWTITCRFCYGSGRVAAGPWGVRPPRVQCPDCKGTGVEVWHGVNR